MQGLESAGIALAHEPGHNLGLIHTTTENCGALLAPLCASSAAKKSRGDEYGGDDLMGSGSGFLNPVMLRALGYLTPDATTVLRADAAGPVRAELAPNSTSGGVRALRAVQGRNEWFLSYDATDAPPMLRVHASRRRGGAVQQRQDPLTGWFGIPAGASVRVGRGFLTVVSLDGVATVEVDGLPSGMTYRAVLLRDAGAGFAPVSVSAAFATAPDTSTAPAISVVPGEGSVTVSWTGGSARVIQVRYCWTRGNETLSYWVTPWISTIETIPMDGPNGTIWLDLVSPSGDRYSVVAHRWGKGCKG